MSATIGTSVVLAADGVEGFGADPWWIIAIKVVGIFGLLMVFTLFNIWFERRVVARMQHRVGPNRAGPQGLLQSLADGVKLALKEDIVPKGADRIVFVLAPIISAAAAFLAFAVIPLGPVVNLFGVRTPLQLTDLPVAVLYVLAVTSVGVYGLVLAGWSSGSTYPLLGGLRSAAQVISYEIAMGLSFVAVFLYAGSMSTSEIVEAQASGGQLQLFGMTLDMPSWYAVVLFPSFLIYVVSMVGETNRAPFDLPEAEGELVGGFHTEYSSLKFALFFLAEYINMVTVSALATTLFLGGWRAPWPLSWVGGGVLNTGWWPLLWFLAKVLLVIYFFVWLRGTLPRLRYDQFMHLGWKYLIPGSLAWILIVATVRTATTSETLDRRTLILWTLGVILGLLLLSFVADAVRPRRPESPETTGAATAGDGAAPREFDPFAGGYPVPPLPGQVRAEPVLTSARPASPRGSTRLDEPGEPPAVSSGQEAPRA